MKLQTCIKCSNSKVFIDYPHDIDDIYENIEEYNPDEDRKILTQFDDLIVDMLNNKKLSAIVTKLFIVKEN